MKNIKKFFIIPLLSLATLTSMSYTSSTTTYVKAEEAETRVPDEKKNEVFEKILNAALKTKSFEAIIKTKGTSEGKEINRENTVRSDYKNYKLQDGDTRYYIGATLYHQKNDNSWISRTYSSSEKESVFNDGLFTNSLLYNRLNLRDVLAQVSTEKFNITETNMSYILTTKKEENGISGTYKLTVDKNSYVPKFDEMTMHHKEKGTVTTTTEFKNFDDSKPIELPKEAESAKEVSSEEYQEYIKNNELKVY